LEIDFNLMKGAIYFLPQPFVQSAVITPTPCPPFDGRQGICTILVSWR
jgi:hypothetical protein